MSETKHSPEPWKYYEENACAGIPTEALEAGSLAKALDALRVWTRLRPVQRDDGGHNGCEDCGAIFGEPCADDCEVGAAFRVLGRLP